MAGFTLNNIHRNEETQGGSVGLNIPDPEDPTKTIKVWWDADDFVKMFTSGDKKTKEIILDAMKSGRDSTPDKDYKAALWRWEDRGRKGEKPKKPKESKKLLSPNMSPKSDISEIRIPPKPPDELTMDSWDKDTSTGGLTMDSWDKPFTDESGAGMSPETSPKSDIQGTSAQPKSTMTPEMERLKTPSPYATKEQERRKQGVPVTFDTLPEFTGTETNRFFKYIDDKYPHLNSSPKDITDMQQQKVSPSIFNDYAEKEGQGWRHYEMVDIYKTGSDEDKKFYNGWKKFENDVYSAALTHNKIEFKKATIQRGREYDRFNKQMRELEGNLKEAEYNKRKEAEKYTPENRIKDRNRLADAEEKLQGETQFNKKTGETTYINPTRAQALKEEIELLRKRLGIEDKTAKGASGLQNEDKMRAHLKGKGMSSEQIEATLKEYAARKKQ